MTIKIQTIQKLFSWIDFRQLLHRKSSIRSTVFIEEYMFQITSIGSSSAFQEAPLEPGKTITDFYKQDVPTGRIFIRGDIYQAQLWCLSKSIQPVRRGRQTMSLLI